MISPFPIKDNRMIADFILDKSGRPQKKPQKQLTTETQRHRGTEESIKWKGGKKPSCSPDLCVLVPLSVISLFLEQEIRASFFAILSMAAFCESIAAVRKTRAVSLRAERSVIASGALCHCERSVVSLRAERCVIASGALCHCERSEAISNRGVGGLLRSARNDIRGA